MPELSKLPVAMVSQQPKCREGKGSGAGAEIGAPEQGGGNGKGCRRRSATHQVQIRVVAELSRDTVFIAELAQCFTRMEKPSIEFWHECLAMILAQGSEVQIHLEHQPHVSGAALAVNPVRKELPLDLLFENRGALSLP